MGKAELTAELCLVPYGQNAALASGDFSETPLSALVLDLHADQTKLYSFKDTFDQYLRSSSGTDGTRRTSTEDLKSFSMKLVSSPGPTYHKILYADAGAEGLTNAF